MDVLRITSSQNPRIKAAARLRDHRDRRKQGRIILDGWREIQTGRNAGLPLIEVYFDPERCGSRMLELQSIAEAGATLIEVPESVLQKITFGERNEGIVAIAAAPQRTLPELPRGTAPLVLILENLEKPGNVGAILRTASAAAVDAVVAVGRATDFDNPNTIRASLGTVFSVPCCSASTADVKDWLAEHQVQVCAAKVDADRTLFEYDFTPGTAIVLGSESTGLSNDWSSDQVSGLRIPMLGAGDSLNVSVSAAVFVYEALRQRLARHGSSHGRFESHNGS